MSEEDKYTDSFYFGNKDDFPFEAFYSFKDKKFYLVTANHDSTNVTPERMSEFIKWVTDILVKELKK